jgi:hypothetical protein
MVLLCAGPAAPAAATSGVFVPAAEVLSPAEAVEIDRARNGERITVEGEVVGEHLRAIGGGRYVNVLGDEVGLGVWMPDEMAAEIGSFGDYRHTGDIVRVTGQVNIACSQHAGEFDLHAETLTIVRKGEPRHHGAQPMLGVAGAGGVVLAYLLWRRYTWRRVRAEM